MENVPLDKEAILTQLQSRKDQFARKYTVRRMGIFGSIARGQCRQDSDIDIVVEMESPTFDRYMDLKFELEDLFGRDVDLVLADSIKSRLRPVIEKETIYA